jgi:putative tricarboxylic transport membrane protein
VALALVARAATGINVAKLRVISFAGSGDVTTAVIGGHVESAVSPASTVDPQVSAGRMRAIGVSSDKRLEGVLADVPTWREQGVDAVFSNWRGLVGPKDMPAEQVQYWTGIFAKTVETEEWKEELQRSQLTEHFLDSVATKRFLEDQNSTLSEIMGGLGLSK